MTALITVPRRPEAGTARHPELPRCLSCRFADIKPSLLGYCGRAELTHLNLDSPPDRFRLPSLDFGCVLHEPQVFAPAEATQ